MSTDDECDTETSVHSNDDDGDCSAGLSSSESSSQESTVTVSDTKSEGSILASQNNFLREYPNNTKEALTSFERFIFPEWPGKQTAERNSEALEVLRLQLLYGGGFCSDMKLIDLSTPENVRFDSEEVSRVLKLLKEKMRHSTINSVEKFILPNVKQLTTGDMVKNLLGDFCGAFCGEETKVNITEVVLRCDEVSSEFIADDLKWVDSFLSRYNLDRTTVRNFTSFNFYYIITLQIYPTKESKNKEYKKLLRRLRGKKTVDHDRKSFLKRPMTDNNSNTSKRARNETTVGEDKSDAEMINNGPTEKTNSKLYFTTLWDQWKTDKLHEKHINGRGVTIAFLDSGINIAHKAFKGRIVAIDDITCSGNIDLTTDQSGHGTLCASIACGAAFKSTGSKGQNVQVPAGVAPAANIVMYKITDSAGQAHADMITKGLKQCLEDKERYNIDIVLLPYGSHNYDIKMCDAIDALISHRVLVVTASGNHGEWKEISYPGRFGHTICVGAHDIYGHTTPNTSEGQALDFTAPGENLVGASVVHPSAFTTEGGTSVAAACVAGLLALIIQRTGDIAEINSNAKKLSGIELSVSELVHHQDTIKKILRAISKNSSEHKKSDGYGFLKPTDMLLSDHLIISMLYEDVMTSTE